MALTTDGKIPSIKDTKQTVGLNLESRLGGTQTKTPEPKQNQYESTDTHTDTDTPTYTSAHARNPKRKERKNERLQLSVTRSTKERFAKYAADHDTSMNEIVQCLIDQLLDENGY